MSDEEYIGYGEYARRYPRAWKVVDQEIDALVDNQDLIKQTHDHLIVGSIVKALAEASLLEPE